MSEREPERGLRDDARDDRRGAAGVRGRVILFNGVLMPRIVHRAGEVRVPDLGNLTLEQAQATLEPSGLVLSRAGERFDPAIERGRIASQDPAPGTPVRGHRRVSVTVSLGEEYSSVPELFWRDAARRRDPARALGAACQRHHPRSERRGVRRLVAATDPPAESVLPRGGAVSLLVSTGMPDQVFVMPDLKGREIGRVRMQLEARGSVLSPPAGPASGPDRRAGSAAGRAASRTTAASRCRPPGRLVPLMSRTTHRRIHLSLRRRRA